MNNTIELLKKYIPIGKDNAIHQKELARLIGVKPSKVKKMIQEVRQEGLMDICSGAEGYWIAKDEEEIKQFEKTLRKQAITRLKTSKPMRDTLKQEKGQISLFDAKEDV